MKINQIRVTWLIVLTLILTFMSEQSSRAQVEIEPQNDEKAAPRSSVVIPADNLEKWFFRSSGGRDAARSRLESILTTRVEKLARECALTEVQKRKLLLAGRGDIKRFFDRALLSSDAEDPDESDNLFAEMRPLRANPSGDIFGDGSIFSKTFKSTLTAAQHVLHEKVARELATARHRTTIRWVVATLDTILELSPEAHRQLEVLLIEHTRPPRYFGEYDYYGVLYQASRLPESRFKSILSDHQWTKLSKHIAESKRLESTLVLGGFVPDDDVAAAPGSSERAASPQQKKRG